MEIKKNVMIYDVKEIFCFVNETFKYNFTVVILDLIIIHL